MKLDQTNPLESPVLLLVFNRPDRTARVFDAIRQTRPRKLYVACDHPRPGREDDIVNCEEVKKIVNMVDWPCETHYLYHPVNRGCALAGKMAWDWFFEQEDEMIFVEDDGLVTKSFFYFCQALLEKYRTDDRIAYISGINRGPKWRNGAATYYFSRVSPSTYAMATWKRVYEKYEYREESYWQCKKSGELRKWFTKYWIYLWNDHIFRDYVCNGGETYDNQMRYLVAKYGMLSIIPNINMVSNIGFDETGTHAKSNPDPKIVEMVCKQPMCELSEIVHPIVGIDEEYEERYTRMRLLGDMSPFEFCCRCYLRRLKAVMKKIIRHNKWR